MKKNLFKKVIASVLTLTLVVGTASAISAAVAVGTDVATASQWTSYSIHTKEDKGEWENALIKDGQFFDTNVTEESGKDSHKAYGECAKITKKTPSSFTMDVTSTGWSAQWGPSGKKDAQGNMIYECKQSNPWGVTADKVVNVERGRHYTISFKIKSTLKNELVEEKERKDGTFYNVGTGKWNYKKHIHFKAFDNTDKDGAALTLSGLKATQGTKNCATINGSKADFATFVELDSQNLTDDGFVTVSASVYIPGDKSKYQSKKSTATMGIKFAFGAFIKEYKNESNMSGTIEVKDFKITAGNMEKAPGKVTGVKVKAAKKSLKVSFRKVKGATKYYVQTSLKKNFKKVAKKASTSKKSVTVKKLKAKKKYYVRVRAYNSKTMFYGKWSSVKSKKTK